MNNARKPLLLFLSLVGILSTCGCDNAKTPLVIAREEALAEQGLTEMNEKERVYLRQKAEELARKGKGVQGVNGLSLSFDGPNKVTVLADVQMESQSRVLTFVFRRFWPTPTNPSAGQGQPVPYWREMPEEAPPPAPPPADAP